MFAGAHELSFAKEFSPEDIQDSFMPLLVVEFSILRHSKTTTRGEQGLIPEYPPKYLGKYTMCERTPEKWRRRDARDATSLVQRAAGEDRDSPTRRHISSFTLSLRQRQRCGPFSTVLSCIRGRAAHLTRHPCCAARLCAFMHGRAMGMDPSQGPSAVHLQYDRGFRFPSDPLCVCAG